MKSIKQRLIDKDVTIHTICIRVNPLQLTQEDVDYIIDQLSLSKVAHDFLKHLLENFNLNDEHIHKLLKHNYLDIVFYFPYKLSHIHIIWLAENYPKYLKEIFR